MTETDVVASMEAIGTGGTAIDLDRPLGGAHGMFLVLGLVLDPVQGKQVDLTGPRRVQLSVLVLLYQVLSVNFKRGAIEMHVVVYNPSSRIRWE